MKKSNWFIFFCSFFLIFFTIQAVFRIIFGFAPDFSVFYHSAQNILSGVNIYTDASLYTGLGYPPIVLLPFVPLQFLPYQFAQGIWVLISFLLIYICIILSEKIVEVNISFPINISFFALCCIAFPFRFTLGMGQVNIVALFFLLLFFLNIEKNEYQSLLWYICAVIFKPHFLFFLLPLLLFRKWKFIGYTLLILGALTILCVQVWGGTIFQTYITQTLPELLVFRGREIYYNQSIGAFFSRILPLSFASFSNTVISISIVIGMLLFIRKKHISLVFSLLCCIPVFLLIEPLSWQHHYVFLLPIFIFLFITTQKQMRLRLFLLGSYVLIGINLKYPGFWHMQPFGNILISHVLWGNIVLLSLFMRQLQVKFGRH